MSEFKVGDRVRVIKNNGVCNMIGKCGTVMVTNGPTKNIGIEFDESFYCGHSLGCHCKNGYGRWYEKDCIELIEKTQPIVIYRKGKEVIALNKNTGEKAIAKCHPDDEFNFETGAKIAFGRLFGEETNVDKPDEIKIGDTVEVVDIGAVYAGYGSWSGLVEGKKDYRMSMIMESNPEKNKNYTVVNKKKHDLFNRELFLIRDSRTGQVFIIGDYGIKKI